MQGGRKEVGFLTYVHTTRVRTCIKIGSPFSLHLSDTAPPKFQLSVSEHPTLQQHRRAAEANIQ